MDSNASRWRRFDKLASLPETVVLLGDAICRFNPVHGQGMSVGVQQATLLRDVLGRAREGNYPVREFMRRAQESIEGPWLTGMLLDLADPRTPGQRHPELATDLKFFAALLGKASEDAAVCRPCSRCCN